MLVHTHNVPRVSNQRKVMIVWMDESPMEVGREYDFKRATTVISGHIDRINYRVDVNTYERMEVDHLELNDIASCRLTLTGPIAADAYKQNRATGGFIIIDRITNNTVGAGMIVDVASREGERFEPTPREYTEAEKALNEYIRIHFPEWGCKPC